jgi:S1-C subfamily serine protease
LAPKRPERPQLDARLSAVDYAPLGIRGLLVEAVVPGGLADRAGLLVDDLVLRAGGRPLTQASGLQAMIDSSRGISIQLSVLRAGKSVEVILHP